MDPRFPESLDSAGLVFELGVTADLWNCDDDPAVRGCGAVSEPVDRGKSCAVPEVDGMNSIVVVVAVVR